MNSIILYGSCYGTSMRYAQALAKETGLRCVSCDQAPALRDYDRLFYVGGLYAGGVWGLSAALRKLPTDARTELILLTVGLADPEDPENRKNIKASAQKQIPGWLFQRTRIFHLRGGIDYQKLNFKHRTMMKMLYHKVKKIPPDQQNAETKAMIETYGQTVDFVDFNRLRPVIEQLSL